MTFAPKFTDLVRNYTSTSGTDDFVLGPAVNGFSSFADALQVGDSFYYSALGVDTPAETEVGRGTLLDGGIVSRDPLSGVKTGFSNGTKSIALVAASEWFAELDLVRASPVNAKTFGARGDSDSSGSSGTDDTAAIQAALDHIGDIGGGTLFFPEGYYKVSSYLNVPAFATLIGAGRNSSVIIGVHAGGGGANAAEDARNGSVFYSAFPINTTSTAHITLEKLGAGSANPANEGAAFYQQSGDTVIVCDCNLGGSKWGIILDQSEDVLIEGCQLGSGVAGGAGLWIVNGDALTPGASPQFTNAITLIENHYNVGPDIYGIVDDGGVSHRIIGGDFNGGVNGLRASGVVDLTLIDPYFESQSSDCVGIYSSTLGGNGTVGGCSVSIVGGFFSASAGNAAIRGHASCGSLNTMGGYYAGGGGTYHVSGAANFYQVCAIHPINMVTAFLDSDSGQGGAFTDVSQIAAETNSGRIGARGHPGVTGGMMLTPNAANGFIETFSSAGVRQGYGFFPKNGVLQFAAEGANTSFQFLSPVSCKGSITSTAGGVGYATGAGGTVTQATSKSTGVTLNKLSGQITMNAQALAAGATSSFLLTDSQIAAGDLLVLNHVSGGTLGAYNLNAHGSAAGSVTIDVTNVTAASLAEPIVIGFAVIKAVTA